MAKEPKIKILTDEDVKRKAVKMVISHLKKKVPREYVGNEHIRNWITDMDTLLGKSEFNLLEYINMRKNLNDVIERTFDEEVRFGLRDSWYSFGKALDKKTVRK